MLHLHETLAGGWVFTDDGGFIAVLGCPNPPNFTDDLAAEFGYRDEFEGCGTYILDTRSDKSTMLGLKVQRPSSFHGPKAITGTPRFLIGGHGLYDASSRQFVWRDTRHYLATSEDGKYAAATTSATCDSVDVA